MLVLMYTLYLIQFNLLHFKLHNTQLIQIKFIFMFIMIQVSVSTVHGVYNRSVYIVGFRHRQNRKKTRRKITKYISALTSKPYWEDWGTVRSVQVTVSDHWTWQVWAALSLIQGIKGDSVRMQVYTLVAHTQRTSHFSPGFFGRQQRT